MFLVFVGSFTISLIIIVPITVGIIIWHTIIWNKINKKFDFKYITKHRIENFDLGNRIGTIIFLSVVMWFVISIFLALLSSTFGIKSWLHSVGSRTIDFIWPDILWFVLGLSLGLLLFKLPNLIGRLPSGYVYLPFNNSVPLDHIWSGAFLDKDTKIKSITKEKAYRIIRIITLFLIILILIILFLTKRNKRWQFTIGLITPFIFHFFYEYHGFIYKIRELINKKSNKH